MIIKILTGECNAYLDKNQPNGVTIYSPKFKQRHSPNVVPYDEWIELD